MHERSSVQPKKILPRNVVTPHASKPTDTHLVRAMDEIEVCQHLVNDLESFADGLVT